jgi:hypothetical protein
MRFKRNDVAREVDDGTRNVDEKPDGGRMTRG